MGNLEKISTEELERELEKRKFSRIPIKKQNINWDELTELTDKIVSSIIFALLVYQLYLFLNYWIVKDRYDDEDNCRWVYEQTMITIYGYDYWKDIEKFLE